MEPTEIIAVIFFIIFGLFFLKWLFRPRRDKQRCFSREQKDEILKRQNYICATCDDKDWKLFEYHHKINWADNGRTDVENGVALCSKCHTKITRNYSENDRYN